LDNEDYDLIICYNSRDKEIVKTLYGKILDQGIIPWLDINIQSDIFSLALEKVAKKVRAAAIVIGPNGLGRWQSNEYAFY